MRARLRTTAIPLALAAGVITMLAACTSTGASTGPTDGSAEGSQWIGSTKETADLVFATSVKVGGVNWFIRMEEGVVEFGEAEGVKAFLQGPSTADVAQQIKGVQDMLAQGIDALVVVPMEVAPMEQIMKQAMDDGIVVVTHEASNVKNALYDLEAFDNAAYGENLMKNLATAMGEKGEYSVFVGSLNSTAQVEWMDAAIAYQESNYPEMTVVGDYNVTDSNQEKAYSISKQLLSTYPNIKGFIGGDAGDVLGAGQAVLEAGLEDDITVLGTSIVSYAGELMKTGAIDMISTWDPAAAGFAANVVALRAIQGQKIADGDDLGVPGFESVRLDGKVIYGNAWVDITVENMADYDF